MGKLKSTLETRLMQYKALGKEEFEKRAAEEAAELSKASFGKQMLHAIG